MPRVLILGGDSDYNLGDAAILAALCACFRGAGASSVTFTSSLSQPQLPFGATAVIRRGLMASTTLMRAASDADLVVVGGGGLFQDDDSRVKMPYWASRIAALRLANRNLVGHSVGAGPLQHPESRLAARFTCGALASITVRDTFAQSTLQACTAVPIGIVPDPAFMLEPAATAAADNLLASLHLRPGRPLIGLCLRKWFHSRGGLIPSRTRSAMGLHDDSGKEALSRLLDGLAATIAPLAASLDASILLLPTYAASYENDVAVCEEFATRMRNCVVRLARLSDPALYKAITGRMRIMISSRMHPLILAAGMGTPIVGLAYNGKFEGMFDMLQIPRRMCWLNDDAEDLPRVLSSLIDQALQTNDDLQHKAANLAALVSRRTAALLSDGLPLAQAAA